MQRVDELVADKSLVELGVALRDVDEVEDHPALGAQDQIEIAQSDVEIDDATLPPRALAKSRMAATVTFHQSDFTGQKATISVRNGDKLLASRNVTLAGDGESQSEALLLNAGDAGAKALTFSLASLPGETNAADNTVTRLVNVQADKRRILYLEGEPR